MTHQLNLFQIANQHQLSLRYRLIEISGLPSGKHLHRNLQKVREVVNRTYGTPAVLTSRGGQPYLAVATETVKQAIPDDLDVPVFQGMAAHLRTSSDAIETLALSRLSEEEIKIATSFLEFTLRQPLRHNGALWQGASAFVYYMKQPLALPGNPRRYPPVALYPGFRFRVMQVAGKGLCVAVDVVHLYADTRTLAERVALGDHWRALIGRYFVYEFGPRWYQIQFQEHANYPISDARFVDPRNGEHMIDVYRYTLDVHGRTTDRLRYLHPDDPALVYTYPHQSEQFYGAMSLARLRYQTEDPEVGAIHRFSVTPPEQRLKDIQHVIKSYLDNTAHLNSMAVQVRNTPITVPVKIFPMPAQRFGHGNILPSPRKDKESVKLMWRTREWWLQDKQRGFLAHTGIRNQYILAPLSIADDAPLMERIEHDIVSAVNALSPTPYRPTVVVWNDQGARTIVQYKQALADAKQEMVRAGVSCALVILPFNTRSRENGRLRQHIKTMMYPAVRTKCIQASELTKYLEQTHHKYTVVPGHERRYQQYLFNTALDTLVTSGYWPWALADPLKHDVHIGLDVLNNTAGFTFVGAGASICRFHPLTSEQKEKLLAEQLCHVLVEHLSQLIPRIQEKTGRLPHHLLIHRDGRWYDTEQEGLDQAVAHLCEHGLLPPDVQIGVVEIHKTSAERFRLFNVFNERVSNPWVGSYHLFNASTGLVCTTGYPGLPQGTAEPLLIKLVSGTLNIEDVLRDIYWLSVLAWTKPDGIQGEPLTIKLADDWLEAVGTKLSDFADIQDRDGAAEADQAGVPKTALMR